MWAVTDCFKLWGLCIFRLVIFAVGIMWLSHRSYCSYLICKSTVGDADLLRYLFFLSHSKLFTKVCKCAWLVPVVSEGLYRECAHFVATLHITVTLERFNPYIRTLYNLSIVIGHCCMNTIINSIWDYPTWPSLLISLIIVPTYAVHTPVIRISTSDRPD